jgi:hypothetical protein
MPLEDKKHLINPENCELCGEPLDAETGEFWDEAADDGVVAHAQCGIDAGLPLA